LRGVKALVTIALFVLSVFHVQPAYGISSSMKAYSDYRVSTSYPSLEKIAVLKKEYLNSTLADPTGLPAKAYISISGESGHLSGILDNFKVRPGGIVYYRFYALHSWKARVQSLPDRGYVANGVWKVHYNVGKGRYDVSFALGGVRKSGTLDVKEKYWLSYMDFNLEPGDIHDEIVDISNDWYPDNVYVDKYVATMADDSLNWELSYSHGSVYLEAKVLSTDEAVRVYVAFSIQVFIFIRADNGSLPPPQPSPTIPDAKLKISSNLDPIYPVIAVDGLYDWSPKTIVFQPKYSYDSRVYFVSANKTVYFRDIEIWKRTGSLGYYSKTVKTPFKLNGVYAVWVRFTTTAPNKTLSILASSSGYLRNYRDIAHIPVKRVNNIYVGEGLVIAKFRDEYLLIYKPTGFEVSYKVTLYNTSLWKFARWEITNNTSTSVCTDNVLEIELNPGDYFNIKAYYKKLDDAVLIVSTNLNSTVNLQARINNIDTTIAISSARNFTYSAIGINFVLTAPTRINVTRKVVEQSGLIRDNQPVEVSSPPLEGRFNMVLKLNYSNISEGEFYVFALRNGSTRVLLKIPLDEAQSNLILEREIELQNEKPVLYFNTTADGENISYLFSLEENMQYVFKGWIYNASSLKEFLNTNTLSGNLSPGQILFLKAIYDIAGEEVYMGPILPLVNIPLDLEKGQHSFYGDFLVFAINETGVYYLEGPLNFICDKRYVFEEQKHLHFNKLDDLPYISSKNLRLVSFKSPPKLGEAKSCVDSVCYVYNVTRLLLELASIEYNITHVILHILPRYQCCPQYSVREHLVYVLEVDGKIFESNPDTPKIEVPYRSLNFTKPVIAVLYARLNPGGRVLFGTELKLKFVPIAVKLEGELGDGTMCFSQPYIIDYNGTRPLSSSYNFYVFLPNENSWIKVEAIDGICAGIKIEGKGVFFTLIVPSTIDNPENIVPFPLMEKWMVGEW